MRALRAALYSRVSTRDQDASTQLDELRRVAEQRGWDVVAELCDVGSGARHDLPERTRLLDLAARGRLDIVAVWRLDRLGRSVRDLVSAADTLQRARVELVSLRETIDTGTPAGRMVFHVLASVAELERELIRERVVAGLDRARRRGARLGRPRQTVDVEAARALLAQGLSVRAAGKRLGVSARTLGRALGARQKPARAGGSESPGF
ncbi:MAG: recombinase family protein [Deltaproteobacteria bacterium]|nr:recombinase family protein [Deltaproteobacteria bacterium]